MRLLRIFLRSTRLERYCVHQLYVAHIAHMLYPREDEE
jgi:hypothetical protein